MINREELTILMEQYLDGELHGDALRQFEARLLADDKFREEFELHQQVRRTFTWSLDRHRLAEKMQKFQDEIDQNQERKRHKTANNRTSVSIWRVAMVAASVSLIITAGALALYSALSVKENKHQAYQNLNRTENKRIAAAGNANEVKSPADLNPSQNVATAFAISSEGYMLTNYHVVQGNKFVYVERFQDSLQKFSAEVVDFDPRLDIALLKINDPQFNSFGSIPYIFSGKKGMIGQKVFTLGYPKNDIVYSEGPVSSLTGYHSDTMALQLSLPVNPGNSGAPVFSENGELLGVITGKNSESDGEAYSVKAEHILRFLMNSEKAGNLKLNKRNLLKGKKVTDQVNALQSVIFIVRA
jgi:S1-C subfamily serine protease